MLLNVKLILNLRIGRIDVFEIFVRPTINSLEG
jgi:hypothetical protein